MSFRKMLNLAVCLAAITSADAAASLRDGLSVGHPGIRSLGTLEFGPEGILFIGDSRSGAVFAVDTGDRTLGAVEEFFAVKGVETKIAAMLGATAQDIVIHDLAVNPISQTMYVSVSRTRGKWESRWQLPNDLGDAGILLRIQAGGEMEEVPLDTVAFARADLSNPVPEGIDHRWKPEATTRNDAITDVVYHEGVLYVAGLSNEEFASTMWQLPFPFGDSPAFSTLEIFHGAHGEYETHAPVRTFLPYFSGGQRQILASYLCTPLVTFSLDDLEDGQHVKGKTVAEFGSGNYPLDMVLCEFKGKQFVVVANSMLPLFTFDPRDADDAEAITEEVPTYTAGVSYVPRAGSGIQQLDGLNEKFLVALQRMPNGKLTLQALSIERLAL